MALLLRHGSPRLASYGLPPRCVSSSIKLLPFKTVTSRQQTAPPNSFNCNTYGPPRKCCKHKTYTIAKSFGCNTYKKTGGALLPSRRPTRPQRTLGNFSLCKCAGCIHAAHSESPCHSTPPSLHPLVCPLAADMLGFRLQKSPGPAMRTSFPFCLPAAPPWS